jgi:hypothetical protein
MRSSRCGGLAVMAVAIVGLVGARPALGADDAAVALGQKLYMQYCASCHGADGKGNGPQAGANNPKPSDLTQLAKKNGGRFPFYETMLLISGRSVTSQDQNPGLPGLPKAQLPKAHGDPKMPVWGEVFNREELSKGTSLDLQMQATGKIMLLTEYLQSIQAK